MSFISNILKYCIWILLLGLLVWFAYRETIKLVAAIKRKRELKKAKAEVQAMKESDKDSTKSE